MNTLLIILALAALVTTPLTTPFPCNATPRDAAPWINTMTAYDWAIVNDYGLLTFTVLIVEPCESVQ